jgi:hypothetical protein
MGNLDNWITALCRKNYIGMNVFGFVWAFVCYFSMYAFRKPFSAESYDEWELWHVDLKIMFVTFQTIGYTASKFCGIWIISGLNPKWRGFWIIGLITGAELALILFGAIPPPYNVIAMLLNGFPLGLIWGLVFSYLEGRKTSEILGSGMAISFIVSSGAVKTVGKTLTASGCKLFWMPAAVGAIFYIPLLIAVFCLESLPGPTAEDVASRTERVRMDGPARLAFFKTFAPGVILMVAFYTVLSAYRDFRDNFAAELWKGFGELEAPDVFTTSEIIVAVIIVIPIALFQLIDSYMWTFLAYHILILGGLLLSLICTIVLDSSGMAGLPYMIATGLGLYIGYVPYNSILFDLFLATFTYKANSGFLMYICDACGYTASIAVLFVKNFVSGDISWLAFYIKFSYAMTVIGMALVAGQFVYFYLKYRSWSKNQVENTDLATKMAEPVTSDNVDDSSGRLPDPVKEDYVDDCAARLPEPVIEGNAPLSGQTPEP